MHPLVAVCTISSSSFTLLKSAIAFCLQAYTQMCFVHRDIKTKNMLSSSTLDSSKIILLILVSPSSLIH